jgi:hypothetical protein
MKHTAWILAAALAVPAGAAAQDVAPARTAGSTPTPVRQAQDRATVPTMARLPLQNRITRGAPYSAETLTESVQVLGDGNRITRKTMTRVYRDTDGRTRTEQFNADGTEVRQVNISDPVAGATYVLHPRTRVAYHTGVIVTTPTSSGTATIAPGERGVITTTRTPDGGFKISAESLEGAQPAQTGGRGGGVGTGASSGTGGAVGRGGGGGGRGMGGARGEGGAPVARGRISGSSAESNREDLPQQMIEGVLATGTRRTTVYPADSIGNLQPIRVVSEEWFSQELQVLVLTKHSDPRTGETTYRVTNISRAEPDPSLFTVPSDYTLEKTFIRREQ